MKDGDGVWEKCAKPGEIEFDKGTMPIQLLTS